MSYSYVYILWSDKLEEYYIGSSSDLERRMSDHNAGYNRSTKAGVPWKLIWRTQKPDKSEAVKLERKLKNLKSRTRLESFIEKYKEDKV